jgi:hypothetical protein
MLRARSGLSVGAPICHTVQYGIFPAHEIPLMGRSECGSDNQVLEFFSFFFSVLLF